MAKKYFRIKSEGNEISGTYIYQYGADYNEDYVKAKYISYIVSKKSIIKWANTLPTLCDMFIVSNDDGTQPVAFYSLKLAKKSIKHSKGRIYGAIWRYQWYDYRKPALISVCVLKEDGWELL